MTLELIQRYRTSHLAYPSLPPEDGKCEEPVKIGFVRRTTTAAKRT